MTWILWWALGGSVVLLWCQQVGLRAVEGERDRWMREARARLDEIETIEAAERERQRGAEHR